MDNISQAFKQAAQETERFLKNFQAFQSKINSDDIYNSSEVLKNEVEKLWNQFSNIPQSGSKDNSGHTSLSSISQNSKDINTKLENLLKEVVEMRQSLRHIKKDAEANEFVQILDVIKKDDRWVIKVRSDKECENNFRNVDIWDIDQDIIVAKFKLIEPKVILKREITDQFFGMSNFVAKIGNRIVSKPFIIYSLEISYKELSDENGFIFLLKNLFNEDLKDLDIYLNSEFYYRIDYIPGNGEQEIALGDINENFTLQLMSGTKYISNLYQNNE